MAQSITQLFPNYSDLVAFYRALTEPGARVLVLKYDQLAPTLPDDVPDNIESLKVLLSLITRKMINMLITDPDSKPSFINHPSGSMVVDILETKIKTDNITGPLPRDSVIMHLPIQEGSLINLNETSCDVIKDENIVFLCPYSGPGLPADLATCLLPILTFDFDGIHGIPCTPDTLQPTQYRRYYFWDCLSPMARRAFISAQYRYTKYLWRPYGPLAMKRMSEIVNSS